MDRVLTSKQKALQINLEPSIYGTFAEIGAGQETVRHFYRAGGASGTLAKAMSAYDKDFSDSIYGPEEDNRYVTQSRLRKMLNWECSLIEQRLSRDKHPDKSFFTYANTVTTIDFAKKFKGHGWIGMRFQLDPLEEYNQIILHVRFHETDARLQQETLGVLGVNLIYGCYFLNDNPKGLLKSLYDNLDKDQVEIDMINFEGPRFMYVDNRLMSLQLVKNGMTDAVIFGPDGNNILPAQLLYKKNIFTIRGRFRPVTRVNIDMLERGLELFKQEKRVDEDKIQVLFEITLSNLKTQGQINERDFLDRADILCRLGHTVLISNFSEYYKLVEYYSRFTKLRMGLVMGANNMVDVFNEKYYRELPGGILEAFGILFMKDLRIYLYPWLKDATNLLTTKTLKVHPRVKELYKYFTQNKRIIDIEEYNEKLLNNFSRETLNGITSGTEGWEEMVPEHVDEVIKDNRLFGYMKR